VLVTHLKNELIALTKELIRIPSAPSRPLEFNHCATFISQWLTQHNITQQKFAIEDAPLIKARSILI